MSIIRKEQLSNPLSASYALTASYALNASTNTTNTGSLLTTASVSSNIITFTKGNTDQFSITVDTGSGGTANTSGFVTTSSFNAFTSSINQFTSSYNTGSFSGSFTGSFYGTASWAYSASQAISSSYALTASYAANAGSTVDTSGFVTTSSFNAFTSSINQFTASYNTGSFSGSFTGSFYGTSSWAENALQALTSSYVNPLNQNVIITGSIYIPDSTHGIYFSGSSAASRLIWNNTDGTLDLGLKGGNVTLQIGQESVVQVINKTGANLLESEYKVVRVRRVDEGGAQGQRLAIVLAQANNDANSVDTLGIVTENIAVNEEGFITNSGLVRNIDTTGTLQGETWTDGEVIYLSPTVPGQLTKVQPQAPDHSVVIGYVVYAHQEHGKIFVKVDNGYEIDELHNVRIASPSSSGDLLIKSGSVWINSKQLTGSYDLTGSLTATSFTGSLFGIASTASYYQETDPIFTAKSASLATTGSNNFNGNQSITGSVTITGSLLVNNGTYDIISSTNETIFSSNGSASIGWGNRILYAADGATTSLNWSSNLVTTSPTFFTHTISAQSQEEFSSNSNYAGTVIEGVIEGGVQVYDLVCLRGGQWEINYQSGVDRVKLKLGIYLGNNLVLTEGHIMIDNRGTNLGPSIQGADFSGSNPPVFVREGDGKAMSCNTPTTGFVKILGHIYYQNQNQTDYYIMRFNPSNDYYLLG